MRMFGAHNSVEYPQIHHPRQPVSGQQTVGVGQAAQRGHKAKSGNGSERLQLDVRNHHQTACGPTAVVFSCEEKPNVQPMTQRGLNEISCFNLNQQMSVS